MMVYYSKITDAMSTRIRENVKIQSAIYTGFHLIFFLFGVILNENTENT